MKVQSLISLALIGSLSSLIVGCASWRNSPQGEIPQKVNAKKMEFSVNTNLNLRDSGVARIMSSAFNSTGYIVSMVKPNTPATEPDVIRVDLDASMENPWFDNISPFLAGVTCTVFPGFAEHDESVNAKLSLGSKTINYQNSGSSKVFYWLPLIVIGPFQESEPLQIDNYFKDVANDISRKIQTDLK